MHIENLVIVGVGLIGGSVGLAAKARGIVRKVIGVGRDEHALARALSVGAIDSYTTDIREAAAVADFVVVCTPVDRVAQDILAVAAVAPPRTVITDVGSTKGNILRELEGKMTANATPFVGSHPLAGSEKKGAANSRADLFHDRLVVVTPTSTTDLEAAAVVELFWHSLGARIMRMDPYEHDRALAITSHLPHASASALAAVAPIEWLTLTAGGFRDSTRIAAGDPELWTAIFQANREAVLVAVDQFLARLTKFRQALADDDKASLIEWLAEGKKVRDALGS